MITNDKITEIFCIIDDFYKKFDGEIKKNPVYRVNQQVQLWYKVTYNI